MRRMQAQTRAPGPHTGHLSRRTSCLGRPQDAYLRIRMRSIAVCSTGATLPLCLCQGSPWAGLWTTKPTGARDAPPQDPPPVVSTIRWWTPLSTGPTPWENAASHRSTARAVRPNAYEWPLTAQERRVLGASHDESDQGSDLEDTEDIDALVAALENYEEEEDDTEAFTELVLSTLTGAPWAQIAHFHYL